MNVLNHGAVLVVWSAWIKGEARVDEGAVVTQDHQLDAGVIGLREVGVVSNQEELENESHENNKG